MAVRALDVIHPNSETKNYLTFIKISAILYMSRGTDDHSQEILGGLARKTRVSGAEDWLTRRGQKIF